MLSPTLSTIRSIGGGGPWVAKCPCVIIRLFHGLLWREAGSSQTALRLFPTRCFSYSTLPPREALSRVFPFGILFL